MILLLLGPAAGAQEDPAWEMRVCAPPAAAPMSSRDEGGFDNDIAEILANQMNAEVTYEWTRLDRDALERTLMAGECDLVIGIAEGTGGVLSTVPYLRAPYVFVSRADRDVQITSLDDEDLHDLTIGTYPTGVPSIALRNRGMGENVREYPPGASAGGPDRSIGILNAVIAGEVDVGIVYGPDAAYRKSRDDVDLRIEPVQPEIDPGATLLQHYRTWTIGVRPHDEALRDRLNIALAERWEDVQQAIASYGVPQASLARPAAGRPERTHIGVVVPAATPGLVPLVMIGEAARLGAELAENVLAHDPAIGDEEVRVLYASAPTDAAARRAARRLIATEEVIGLVGGFGDEQARDLGAIAADAEVLFFNVAAVASDLRADVCRPTTFHVEASGAMYADAAMEWYGENGARRWFVVHGDDAAGARLATHVSRTLSSLVEDAELLETIALEAGRFVYTDVIERIAASGADALLLALPPAEQELFLSQYPRTEDAPDVALVPHPSAQTRESMFRFQDVAPPSALGAQPALWDASLEEGASGETNEAYLSRTGTPLEATSWAAYAAVLILHEAGLRADGNDVNSLISYLTAEGRSFEVGKATPLSFRAWNHQLRQPLYMVQVQEDAPWSRSGRAQAMLAEVVGDRPADSRLASADARGALDRYGIAQEETQCNF